jgi:anti-sigma factor RsiW
MKTMNCNQVRALMDDRLDGRLAEETGALFDRHVAVCPACDREWQTLCGMWSTLDRLPAIEPSVGFAERTLRRLDEPAPSFAERFLPAFWRWTLVGATAVVLAVCGWTIWQRAQDARLAHVYARVHQGDLNDDFDVIAGLDRLGDKETGL